MLSFFCYNVITLCCYYVLFGIFPAIWLLAWSFFTKKPFRPITPFGLSGFHRTDGAVSIPPVPNTLVSHFGSTVSSAAHSKVCGASYGATHGATGEWICHRRPIENPVDDPIVDPLWTQLIIQQGLQ